GGGAVVKADQQALGVEYRFGLVLRGNGHVLDLAANGADGDVALPPVLAQVGGAEPRSDGAAALGQQHAQQQDGHPGRRALVQPVGQLDKEASHEGGQVRQCHGRLLDTGLPLQGSSCPASLPSSPPAPFAPCPPSVRSNTLTGSRKVQATNKRSGTRAQGTPGKPVTANRASMGIAQFVRALRTQGCAGQ